MLKLIPRPAILILPVILLICNAYSQDVPFRFMFYNAENLFDIYDDTLTDDNEFLPAGTMRWNKARYNKKINSLAKTIIAAGEWQPPEIIAFCETENRKVLEDLLAGAVMLKYDYGILHENSPDERGIDVALIYRKDIVRIISSKNFLPTSGGRKITGTRSVLYSKCLIFNDTLHFFVNHWPSRRGGVLAGEALRMEIAGMIRDKVDSLGKICKDPKIIIAGDFNCTPVDRVMLKLAETMDCRLINLSKELSDKGSGTYRFRGAWELIDQVIVSEGLMFRKTGLSASDTSFRIFNPDFLLRDDPAYPGLKPFATYNGYRYQGGFSDHLPVLLDLQIR